MLYSLHNFDRLLGSRAITEPLERKFSEHRLSVLIRGECRVIKPQKKSDQIALYLLVFSRSYRCDVLRKGLKDTLLLSNGSPILS